MIWSQIFWYQHKGNLREDRGSISSESRSPSAESTLHVHSSLVHVCWFAAKLLGMQWKWVLWIFFLFSNSPVIWHTSVTRCDGIGCGIYQQLFYQFIGVKIPFFCLWKQFAFFNTRHVDSTVFPEFVCSIPVKTIFFNLQNVRGAQKAKKELLQSISNIDCSL